MLKNGLMVNDGKKWLYNGMLIDLNTAHLGLHTKREVLPELWGSAHRTNLQQAGLLTTKWEDLYGDTCFCLTKNQRQATNQGTKLVLMAYERICWWGDHRDVNKVAFSFIDPIS